MMRSVILLLLIPMVLASQGWSVLAHAHSVSAATTSNHDARPHFHTHGNGHMHHHGHGLLIHMGPIKSKDKTSGNPIIAGQDHDADAVYCPNTATIRIVTSRERVSSIQMLNLQIWMVLQATDKRTAFWNIARLCDPPPGRYGKCELFLRTLSIRC